MSAESVNFDRAADFYDETRGFPPLIAEEAARFIAESAGLAPQQALLEIGIGTGRIALPLAPYVSSIYGADLSHAMLRKLYEKQGIEKIHAVQADVQFLPYPTATFDHVVAAHIFHLVSDP